MTGKLKWILPLSIVVVLCLVYAYRLWQGPLVEGYVVRTAALVQTVVASGRVESVSRAEVSSEITAVVLERHVEEGQRVEAGELLLQLRDDALQAQLHQAEAALSELRTRARPQARVALERAETQLAQAERESARRRALVEQALISRESLEQAEEAEVLARNAVAAARLELEALAPGGPEERLLEERLAAARIDLERSRIRAETAGTILSRDVEPGDLVRPGEALFSIALDGPTELRVPVDERNLSRLAVGQQAIAIADAYPDSPFEARIEHIAPRIDVQRGTVDLRLAVPEPPPFLRQDMTVSVTIVTGRREDSLALPNDALVHRQGRQARVLVLDEGRIQHRPVTIGLEGLARSEILAGLTAGEQVLLAGHQDLLEGSRARFESRPWPAAGDPEALHPNNELPIKLD
ncbi:efflux RND transporter periplasmic adaptor subunit [Wenzhouxiangella marina]|uniref:Membrane protein n=1 Tax=Wenzhouxiangella marina TaxID=1579979 RepID=A0A0K0XST8_9GAMM|nr:efflux RND transporter periplasmic adaptor subunit [Wenzhouxiangella marina]AKS40715.1 membrane protein [Wenzhouxiangella marina]MBB6087588.1 HlyD family secretion protein [Wenzhouxiangella marina]